METNIVEVENFVQQSEERRGSAFTQEVKRYLERYPNTQYVDVLLTDLNGCFRGKRVPFSSRKNWRKDATSRLRCLRWIFWAMW